MASERDIINTLIAEALGEGPEGMRRVAETINNRALIRGLTPEQVVTQPNQYAGYSNPGPAAVRAMADPNAISAAEAAWQLAQQPGDPTNGADHYFNPNVVRPSWAQSMTPTGDYGGHSFYSSQAVPQQPKVAPTPAAASTALSTTRSNTSPSGGNTALQSALARLATVRANAVTPVTRAFNGDPLNAAPTSLVQSLPTRAIPSTAPISDKVRAANSLARRDLTYPGEIDASVSNAGSKADATLAAALQARANVGNAPTTRTVQSIPMPPISQTPARAVASPPSRPLSLTPTRPVAPVSRPVSVTPRVDGVGSMPSAAQFGNTFQIARLPNSNQLSASTGFRIPQAIPGPAPAPKQPERLQAGVYPLAPTSVGAPRVPVAATSMPPMPIARPSNGGLISSGLIAPMPAPRSQMDMARNGSWNGNVLTPPQGRPISPEFLAQAATRRPIAQALMAPAPVAAPTLRVVVNGGNPIAQALSPVQQSAEWQRVTGTEPRYTDNGNGSRTAAGGGVYYDRNY